MARAADVAFFLASAFLLGVFGASSGWNLFLVAGAAAVLIAVWLRDRGEAVDGRIALLLFALLAGFFYYHLFLNLQAARRHLPLNESASFAGVVSREERRTEKFQRFSLEVLAPYRGEIEVVAAPVPEWAYGDKLALSGTIRSPEIPGQRPTVRFPAIRKESSGHGFWLERALLHLKSRVLHNFDAFLPRDHAALVSGILLGERGEFTEELKEAMAKSGTTHLVALSGYNIEILVLAVSALFLSWVGRRFTFGLTLLFVLLFVLMVGAQASVIRAAIMGMLLVLAQSVGRLYYPRNAIAAAAFVMTLVDPTILRFDIGFQLSFVALLGIVYMSKAFERFLAPRGERSNVLAWRENAATTLSAQLAVAPLLVGYFHEFSLTSFLANMLILPLVPLTMFLGFALGLVGLLSASLGVIVGWLLHPLLAYELGVIRLFAEWTLPLPVDLGRPWVFALYYLILIGVVLHAARRKTI